MTKLLDPEMSSAMGHAARKHVIGSFSRETFGDKLDAYVRRLGDDEGTLGGRSGFGSGGSSRVGNTASGDSSNAAGRRKAVGNRGRS